MRAFDDLFAVGREDRRENYGEARFIQVGMAGDRLLTVAYTMRGERIRIISARKSGRPYGAGITKRTGDGMPKSDRSDTPMTDAEWASAPRVPRVTIIRRALKLSQEEFSEHFEIPVGTLRDWEQQRKEPDAAAKAYLKVITADPDGVRRALAKRRVA